MESKRKNNQKKKLVKMIKKIIKLVIMRMWSDLGHGRTRVSLRVPWNVGRP